MRTIYGEKYAPGFSKHRFMEKNLNIQKNDVHEEQRNKLRNAFIGMRANASELVKLIPIDCKGLTVHDITHLDALWETADAIAGEEFDLNPAEAFVFGCAVLTHDAGMSVAAFPGGMPEVTSTDEWSDIVYSIFRRTGTRNPRRETIFNPPSPIREEAIFSTIRSLHAKQAEKLCSIQWTSPSTGNKLSLLEDQSLVLAYGRSIGQIAHSHNWSIDRLLVELRTNIGAASNLPPEWGVNEVKIACLLRCADAAHIDHRRAPSMLYALQRPEGFSDLHWRFQNKLNKVTYDGDSIIYSSNNDFLVDEAAAWWLCFDTIRMIDKEILTSNAMLQEIGVKPFKAKRVYGAESPRLLARQIKPAGWRPVDAEVKVSHPVHLAETLGGKNLYGKGSYAPIRELLQNAADAVRARRRLEERRAEWGQIRLTISQDDGPSGKRMWLHVDDTGVGMSERVLTGPLIDFGKSLWNSTLLHEEFPGLDSKGYQPVGKFGIGFFSVFLLGKNVKVISKSYLAGYGDIRVLEFNSLSSRPILRDARQGELPVDFSTRVSIQLDRDLEEESRSEFEYRVMRYDRRQKRRTIHEVISSDIRRLVSSLDINVTFDDEVSGAQAQHSYNWESSSPEDFIRSIYPSVSPPASELIISMHKDLIDTVIGADGTIYGRAALWMKPSPTVKDENLYATSLVSVGGFAYSSNLEGYYLGVFSGETDDVSRARAITTIPAEAVSKWATRQAELIDHSKYSYTKLINTALRINKLGGNPGQLPVCFLSGKLVSLSELEAAAATKDAFHLLLYQSTDDTLYLRTIDGLESIFFLTKLVPNFICLTGGTYITVAGKEMVRNFKRYPVAITETALGRISDEFTFICEVLKRIWCTSLNFSIGATTLIKSETYQPAGTRWTLSVTKGQGTDS